MIRGEIMAKSATAEIRSSEATGRGCRAADEMAIEAPYEKPISVIDKLIEDSNKIEGKWKSGTVPRAADDD